MKYNGWALSVIALICNDAKVSDANKVGEIKCVVDHSEHYKDCFDDGDSPSEAWEAAKGAYSS